MGQGAKMWFLATRPWSFPMTFISITVGTLFAYFEGVFNIFLYILTLIGSILAHAGANVLNDYYDTKHKVDMIDAPTAKYRPHPVLTGFMTLHKLGIFGAAIFSMAVAIGIYLTIIRGLLILIFAGLGFVFAVSYSGGPFKYKYKALGELAVFFVWGPLMTLGSYYVQTGWISWKPIVTSIPIGLLVSAVLLADNMRDTDYDRKVGIKTLPIIVGKDLALKIYSVLVTIPYIFVIILVIFEILPLWCVATIITLPKSINLIRRFKVEIPENADPLTANLTITFGIIFLVSFLLGIFISL